MPSIGTNSKPAYVYDAGTDTWIPIGPGEHTHDYIGKDVITTTGDLIYASAANTPARRGIGSTGEVLTVSGGVPTWAAPSAGAMVFITGATFTTVSSVSFPTNTFTSTYDIYKIFFQFSAASSTTAVQIRMRNGGSDVTSGNYFYAGCNLA